MEGGITNGGAGVLIEDPDGQEHLLTVPAGGTCSSYRAELVALREALRFLLEQPAPPHAEPVVICIDSQSALSALRGGPSTQTSLIGGDIWSARGPGQECPPTVGPIPLRPVREREGGRAGEANLIDGPGNVPVDVATVVRAVTRTARAQWVSGWYSGLMEGTLWSGQAAGPCRGGGRTPVESGALVGIRPIPTPHRPEPCA